MADEKTKTESIFSAEQLKTMCKNYNDRILASFFAAQQKGKVSKDEEVIKITEADCEKMAIQIINKKLALTGGATIDEMAAMLAIRFGTTGSGFSTKVNFNLLESKDITDKMRADLNNQWQKEKEEWESRRRAEVGSFREPVRKYLATFGKEIRNPMGQLLGIGEEVVVSGINHFRLA